MTTADYTVRLEQVFQGPLDLLLHLVREQEVDIHEVELERVIDGYLAWLDQHQKIDVDLAADFVVMAATLLSIKARSLLPRQEVDLEQELDPRDELIQRLIEYRHFKRAAGDLGERLDARARIFPRSYHEPNDDEPTLDLGDLSSWDLLSTFSRLMRETLAHRTLQITPDERPLRWYVERLVGRVKSARQLSLRGLVESDPAGGDRRPMLIGTFCALLELMKLGVVHAFQTEPRGDITIALREDLDGDVDDIVRLSGFDDEASPASQLAAAPAVETLAADGPGEGA